MGKTSSKSWFARFRRTITPAATWSGVMDVLAQISSGEIVYSPHVPDDVLDTASGISTRLSVLEEDNARLSTEKFALQMENKKLQKRVDDLMTRNSTLEIDARKIAAEGLLAQAHSIDPQTRFLLITTPNVTLLNHATYANLTNRLQRICTNLDAIMMVEGELKIDQFTASDAASKLNVVAIPSKAEWHERREEVIKTVTALFDRYSREK